MTAADPSTKPPPVTEERPGPASFYGSLPGAFVFPFRRSGWAILVAGTVVFTLGDWVGSLNVFLYLGFTMLFRGLLGLYVLAYMLSIIAEAGAGEDAPPDWPSLTDLWSDVFGPLFRVVVTALVSFGPLMVYVVVRRGQPSQGPAFWPLVALGAAYLPMGLISVAMHGSVAALNPFTVIVGIVRTLPAYLVAVVAFFAVLAANLVVHGLLTKVAPMGISPPMWFATLYFLMVEMYILGRLYYTHSRRLGWFE